MTPTHIMLTEQGFVAFELPDEYSLSHKEQFISTSVLFAPEEQKKVEMLMRPMHDCLQTVCECLSNGRKSCPKNVNHYWPQKNVPYALPDGVQVEIREICGHTNRECGDSCDDCNKFPYKRAYLNTKEVKEESQDQIIEDLIATWQATCGAVTGDEYSEVKRKFKVTRI